MRNIDEAGYTMAKSAVVTLTRSFAQRGRNGPWRLHGIKAFALCPWFADTQLVRDAKLDLDFVNAKAKQRTLTVSEVNVKSFNWIYPLKRHLNSSFNDIAYAKQNLVKFSYQISEIYYLQ